MILRIFTGVAFVGMVASFALATWDFFRFADRFCGDGEGGGNCRTFADYYAEIHIVIFAVFATALAILLLLLNSKSTGR